MTTGVTRQLGARGLFRVDGIYRTWTDFYFSRRDTATGTVQDPAGIARDLTIIGNSTEPERQYAAMNLQAAYRLGSRLNLNAVYTLSRTWGNFDGETINNGPITAGVVSAGSATTGRTGWGTYPEYYLAAWNRPIGDLANDQRHRARFWARLAPADRRAVRQPDRERPRTDQHRQPLLRRRSGQPEHLPDEHVRVPDAARPRRPISSPTATLSAPTRCPAPTWR